MKQLISTDRSIIPACDVRTLQDLDKVVSATYNLPGIGGYKVGMTLVDRFGMLTVAPRIRSITQKKVIIWDRQKAGTDIPEMGEEFALIAQEGGVHAAIVFPLAGNKTEVYWIQALHDKGVVPIIGGHMTHEGFITGEGEDGGGFIGKHEPERMYRIGAKLGVRHFVLPGNKPELVEFYRAVVADQLGDSEFVVYAPGFVAQGGVISKTGQVAGQFWHAIAGRAIYTPKTVEEVRASAAEMTSQIL